MIRAKLCFAALAIVRDAETNTISAFNILEELTAVGLPFFLPNVSFLALWERDIADPTRAAGTLTISIDELVLSTIAVELDFGTNLRNRLIANANGLVVPRSGALRFSFEFEPRIRADYVINVAPPPAAVQLQA